VDGEIMVERRRQWTPEAKAALMAEVEAEGGQVLVVAPADASACPETSEPNSLLSHSSLFRSICA
jgi:hypothetical protein